MKRLASFLLIFTSFYFFTPSPVFAAGITVDNHLNGTTLTTGTAATQSYTVSGTNTFLAITLRNNTNTNAPTSVTYNGVAMTQSGNQTIGNGGSRGLCYTYFGPATGTHNIVINSTSIQWIISAVSFNGVNQSGFDASNFVQKTNPNPSGSITTVKNNAVAVLGATNADDSYTASTNTTLITSSAPEIWSWNNAALSPGSITQALADAGTRTAMWCQFSLAPISASFIPWQFWAY